jgi:hypothetical protein
LPPEAHSHLLSQLEQLRGSNCSKDHQMSKQVLLLGLETVELFGLEKLMEQRWLKGQHSAPEEYCYALMQLLVQYWDLNKLNHCGRVISFAYSQPFPC